MPLITSCSVHEKVIERNFWQITDLQASASREKYGPGNSWTDNPPAARFNQVLLFIFSHSSASDYSVTGLEFPYKKERFLIQN